MRVQITSAAERGHPREGDGRRRPPTRPRRARLDERRRPASHVVVRRRRAPEASATAATEHVQGHRDEGRERRVVHAQQVEPGEQAADDGAAVLPP